MKDENLEKEQSRVLFTGYGDKIIDNIMGFLPPEYEKIRCAPMVTDFNKALEDFQPHIVVFCLRNETRDALRGYYILNDDPQYANLPIVGVGHEDDCILFKQNIPAKYIKTFIRPLEKEKFLKCLEDFGGLAKEYLKYPKKEPDEIKEAEEIMDENDSLLELKNVEKGLIRKIQRMNIIHGRKSILVVDDDVQMLNVIKLYLQDLYDVSVVPSGKLALKFIEKKATDLVLLDYLMPEMDGPSVLQKIREDSSNPEVPVIFLTGVSDKDSVMRGLEFRPNGYLLKPIARDTLLERVTEIVLEL